MKRILSAITVIILSIISVLFAACAPTKTDTANSSSETIILSSSETSTDQVNDPTATDKSTLFSIADNTQSCEKMITKSPSLEDIFKVPGFGIYFSARSHSGYLLTIDRVNEMQEVECLRRKDNGDYYAIFHPKEGGRVYSFFPKQDQYYLSHSIYLLTPLDRKRFEQLQKGDSFTDVLSIDPAIRKCYENGFLCNAFSVQDITYTLHMFENELMLISYKEENGNTSPDQIFIDTIQWFEDGELFIDAPNYLIHGSYDYSILPQDYIK